MSSAADPLAELIAGHRFDASESESLFTQVLRGEFEPVRLAALLGMLAARGETSAEVLGAARAMRAAAVPFEHDAPDAIDTCGTGGDGLGTFNISTAAALVACAAGARVIKHGNRAASSRSGSADLLEALGLPLELEPGAAREVFEEVGITFLFAPSYHPALAGIAPVRRALGIRTIFNLLGPMCHPGGIRRHLLGIASREQFSLYVDVMTELQLERGYLVHGAGGADELTLAGRNQVHAIGPVPNAEGAFDAAGLGLTPAPVEALAGGEAQDNVKLLQQVLAGETGPLFDAVLLNSAAALCVAGVADCAADGLERARTAIDSGAARHKLENWIEVARRTAQRRNAG